MNVVIFQKKGLSRKPENPLFMVPPGRFERPAHGKAQVNGNARLPFVPQEIAEKEAAAKEEVLIQAEMGRILREQAVTNLRAAGKVR